MFTMFSTHVWESAVVGWLLDKLNELSVDDAQHRDFETWQWQILTATTIVRAIMQQTEEFSQAQAEALEKMDIGIDAEEFFLKPRVWQNAVLEHALTGLKLLSCEAEDTRQRMMTRMWHILQSEENEENEETPR